MIVDICEILIYCVAITTNIKTIESAGNQINPIRFVKQTSHENYVRTVNKLKTLNKHPIVIKPADVKILSRVACDSIKKYKLKLKSQVKLEKKCHDIKCSFCVIAKSNILHLMNLNEKLRRGEPYIHIKETVKRLEEEAKIIIRILLLANLETGKWLWMYFLKIVAISQYDDNKHFIHENLFEDDQLHSGVSDFIRNCIAESCLPSTAMDSHLVSKNKKISNNMFHILRNSRWVTDVLNDRVLVSIEFLYLKPFWDDENQLLFRQITEVNVDWSEPKQRHEAEVAITREFVENRTWMYKPYGRLDHQHLLMKIIDARFYCSLWVILHVYEKQLSILNEQTLEDIKYLIDIVVFDVLQITAFKDEFLVNILSELVFLKINDIVDLKDILARVRTKANEILNDLNCASTSEIDRLSLDVNEHQLSTDDFIIRIIRNFKDYLEELKRFYLPFDYKVLLHFMDEVKISAAPYI